MAGINQFSWPVRVYYEDTDGGGVVYHSNYLKFMERARTEWLRSMGFEQTELREKLGVLFVVRSLKLKYRQPARFNDALSVITRITRIGYSLLEFEQTIYRGEELLTSGTVEVVCVDTVQFKPMNIPDAIRTATQLMEPQ
jgi:acyl-CoA thioester hydrolase